MRAMTMIGLVLALAAAGGAGYYGWQKTVELEATKAELASTLAALDKSKAEARAAKAQAEAAQAELAEQKVAADKLRIELQAATSFIEAEKALSARLRQELAVANEKLVLLANRSRGTVSNVGVQAVPVQIRPMVIRAGPAGMAASAASPAQAPAMNAVSPEAPAQGPYRPPR